TRGLARPLTRSGAAASLANGRTCGEVKTISWENGVVYAFPNQVRGEGGYCPPPRSCRPEKLEPSLPQGQIRELAMEIARWLAREQFEKERRRASEAENRSDLREVQLGPPEGSEHS